MDSSQGEGVRSMQRISVIITNYNYARFLRIAIDSALALRWADVEVVVSDDGSTDGSRAIIESYGDRVIPIFSQNGSQRVAANRGFERSSGDVVIFLDSDDVLPPDLPRHLERVWGPRVSKVQFQMQRIDIGGRPLGKPFPEYDPVPAPQDIYRWARLTSAYPTPPGSGNVYARWFVESIFPAGPEMGDYADSALLAAAPFLGDVISVAGLCVGYRQHHANDSNMLADLTRFSREVRRARARWALAQEVSGSMGRVLDGRALFRSRELLQFRVAARRTPGDRSPLPRDGSLAIFRDALLAPFWAGPERWNRRLMISIWCVAMLIVPERNVERLLVLRFRHRV